MLDNIKFPVHFFDENRKKLLKKMQVNSVCFITSALETTRNADNAYSFRQDSNFYYYTGLEINRAILVLVKTESSSYCEIYRNYKDPKWEKWIGKDFADEELTSISRIDSIKPLKELDECYNYLFQVLGLTKVYLYNEQPVSNVLPTYTQMLAKVLRDKFAFISFEALNPLSDELRRIKQPIEIKMIKRAIEITGLGLQDLLKKLKPGMNEREAEAILGMNYLKHGSNRDFAFQSICASGVNSCVLHYEQNNCRMKEKDLLLIDTGAEYKNYSSDISRTIPVKGKYSQTQKKFYDLVYDTLKRTCSLIKPGITLKELNDHTTEMLAEGLKKLKIIKKPEEISKYYYHGVSHFMGLDTHDVGNTREPLKAGCVLTVEPGIYIPEKSIGIRLENDILVTKTGFDNLSKNIPVKREEIEELMNQNLKGNK